MGLVSDNVPNHITHKLSLECVDRVLSSALNVHSLVVLTAINHTITSKANVYNHALSLHLAQQIPNGAKNVHITVLSVLLIHSALNAAPFLH